MPLIPLIAGLAAFGNVAGGASAISQTVIDKTNAQKMPVEDRRYNTAMEEMGKKGAGLYLKKMQ